MYRILFSAMLLTGIGKTVSAQSTISDNISGISPSKNAAVIVEKLNPKISEASLPGSGSYYKFGLDLASTKAILPDVIRTGTKWTDHGKNNPRATNIETVDYASLVPVLVAAIQDQQEQIAELKKEISGLKKETASR